jgi:hypothetical protein
VSRVINEIFFKVDDHIKEETLIRELNMSALPSLYEQFLKLIEYLVIVSPDKLHFFFSVELRLVTNHNRI